MASETASVCRFFSSKDISISSSNEWVKSCIEWFKVQNAECSIQQIQEFAYDQLLLADLCVVAHGCLPPTITEARTIQLLGKYFLQINYVIDVGKSAYSQFQILRKRSVNLEVTEEKQEAWEPQPNRMLKLEMTDGISVIYGMEYLPIKKLNVSTIPGTKIIVRGPVECRSGVILLQDKDITLLGGEVDSLCDCNSYQRLITRTLKVSDHLLPVNDEDPEATVQSVPSPPPPLFKEPSNNNKSVPTTVLHHSSADSSTRQISSYSSGHNNYSNEYYQQFLDDDNGDLLSADSELFLNVPVDDINVNEGTCVKKKLIEINGSVTAFKSKLIIKENCWFVIVRLNSEEGSMKASFDPDLLDRLIGFSPIELSSKENDMAVNPAVKEKMNSMLKRGQQVIKNLKCHMTLVHEEGSELPVIIAISDDNAFYNPTK